MYKILSTLMLCMLPCVLVAEEVKKREFSEEQLNQLRETEEKYKDNPGMMKLIQKVKEQSGLTEETAETEEPAPPPPPPPEPAIQGDPDIAAEAYKKRDYETALKHYQALAAEGDADASLRLGTMYDTGRGIDRDPAMAHAWYKKAADLGDSRAKTTLSFIEKHSMDEDDMAKAEMDYEQITKEPDDETTTGDKVQHVSEAGNAEKSDAGETSKTYADVNPAARMSLLPGVIPGQWEGPAYTETREAGITLEKFNPMLHEKPALKSDHFQPDKFNRQLSAETRTDS